MTMPECTKWEPSGYAVLRHWQQGRCGMCGCAGDLVMDHDHTTGNIRGYLCPGCNVAEPHAVGRTWEAWRNGSNPAAMLGIVEEYRYFSRGQKLIEQDMRKPVSDDMLQAIADAAASDDGEWAVDALIRRADEHDRLTGRTRKLSSKP